MKKLLLVSLLSFSSLVIGCAAMPLTTDDPPVTAETDLKGSAPDTLLAPDMLPACTVHYDPCDDGPLACPGAPGTCCAVCR